MVDLFILIRLQSLAKVSILIDGVVLIKIGGICILNIIFLQSKWLSLILLKLFIIILRGLLALVFVVASLLVLLVLSFLRPILRVIFLILSRVVLLFLVVAVQIIRVLPLRLVHPIVPISIWIDVIRVIFLRVHMTSLRIIHLTLEMPLCVLVSLILIVRVLSSLWLRMIWIRLNVSLALHLDVLLLLEKLMLLVNDTHLFLDHFVKAKEFRLVLNFLDVINENFLTPLYLNFIVGDFL